MHQVKDDKCVSSRNKYYNCTVQAMSCLQSRVEHTSRSVCKSLNRCSVFFYTVWCNGEFTVFSCNFHSSMVLSRHNWENKVSTFCTFTQAPHRGTLAQDSVSGNLLEGWSSFFEKDFPSFVVFWQLSSTGVQTGWNSCNCKRPEHMFLHNFHTLGTIQWGLLPCGWRCCHLGEDQSRQVRYVSS